jgi:hypothetical protein
LHPFAVEAFEGAVEGAAEGQGGGGRCGDLIEVLELEPEGTLQVGADGGLA